MRIIDVFLLDNTFRLDSKILNDFHTILLSHNLITGIGFITESPRKYRYLYEYKKASKDKVNVKVFSKTSDLNKRTKLFLDQYYKSNNTEGKWGIITTDSNPKKTGIKMNVLLKFFS